MSSTTQFNCSIKTCISLLKPFHGVLLMDGRKTLLDKLLESNSDGSPIVRFVRAHCPTKNLRALSERTNIGLALVFRIVARLIHWGHAILMFPLAPTNMYAVSSTVPTAIIGVLHDRFGDRFPGYDLNKVMHEFSTPTSLQHVMGYVDKYTTDDVPVTDILIWLLRHRIVTQFHTFLYHTSSSNKRVTGAPGTSSARRTSTARTSTAAATAPAAALEATAAATAPAAALEAAAADSEESRAFGRLRLSDEPGHSAFAVFPQGQQRNIPDGRHFHATSHDPEDLLRLMELLQRGYLAGKFHVEEIAFLESTEPAVILQLLDSFHDVIKTYETEDPIVCKCNMVKTTRDPIIYA